MEQTKLALAQNLENTSPPSTLPILFAVETQSGPVSLHCRDHLCMASEEKAWPEQTVVKAVIIWVRCLGSCTILQFGG